MVIGARTRSGVATLPQHQFDPTAAQRGRRNFSGAFMRTREHQIASPERGEAISTTALRHLQQHVRCLDAAKGRCSIAMICPLPGAVLAAPEDLAIRASARMKSADIGDAPALSTGTSVRC